MRRLALASFITAFGCGGPGSKIPTTTTDGGADAAALPTHLVSTLPTDVRNPPPFALGSKHAQVRAHPEWSACHSKTPTQTDPSKALDAIAQGCASATKMHSTGASMTGSQNATSSQPIVYKFHGQAKHCYRLYAATGAAVKSLVAVVTDAAGAEIAEYHTDDVTPFIAPEEAMCFSDDADVQITASVGIGDGPYALSVWSD